MGTSTTFCNEIDIVGVIVHSTDTNFTLADNTNSFITVGSKSSWKVEALDHIIAVSNLVAVRNLQLRNGQLEVFFDPRYSEIFWKSSEFSEKSVLFKKFNSMKTRIEKVGVESYLKAYDAFKENGTTPVTPQRNRNGPLPQVFINENHNFLHYYFFWKLQKMFGIFLIIVIVS